MVHKWFPTLLLQELGVHQEHHQQHLQLVCQTDPQALALALALTYRIRICIFITISGCSVHILKFEKLWSAMVSWLSGKGG